MDKRGLGMIEIIFEDRDIVACVKPCGISSENDLPKALKEQLSSEIYTLHRLDVPVGGVMVYAKNKAAAAKFSQKISEKTDFIKTYLVLCEGIFEEQEGEMYDLLFKDSRKNKSFVVKRERKGVKKARLFYKVLGSGMFEGKEYSLVEVRLETGRSHQIRVQFSSRRHPLFGDGKYGSTVNCPIGLYSHKIETENMIFEKELPDEKPWNILKKEVQV